MMGFFNSSAKSCNCAAGHIDSEQREGKTQMRRLITPALTLAIAALAATGEARVTRIVIDAKVSPAFEGATFGSAGQYETLTGRALGELDPNDQHNAIIQDIALAPRNQQPRRLA